MAREYGLPCIVAVTDACRTFRTGDVCVIDADRGVIALVERVDMS